MPNKYENTILFNGQKSFLSSHLLQQPRCQYVQAHKINSSHLQALTNSEVKRSLDVNPTDIAHIFVSAPLSTTCI